MPEIRRGLLNTSADLLIASTAATNELAIYTRSPSDLKALENIVDIIAI